MSLDILHAYDAIKKSLNFFCKYVKVPNFWCTYDKKCIKRCELLKTLITHFYAAFSLQLGGLNDYFDINFDLALMCNKILKVRISCVEYIYHI